MKKIIIILLIFVQNLFSQTEQKASLIDKMGNEVCECSMRIDFNKGNDFVRSEFNNCLEASLKNHENEVIQLYGANYLEYYKPISRTIEKYLDVNCSKLQEKSDNARPIDQTVVDETVESAVDTIVTNVGVATEGSTGKFKGTFVNHFKFLTLKKEKGKTEFFVFLNSTFDDDLILKNKLKLNQEIEIRYFEQRLYNAFLKKFEDYKVIEEIITNTEARK